MEEEVVGLLAATQQSAETPRKQAELRLQQLHEEKSFPIILGTIASLSSVPENNRQAALLYLKKFIQASWSPEFEEYGGRILIDDDIKGNIRDLMLNLALSNNDERKIRGIASNVVSKIASVDYPERWPNLLPTLLQIIPHGSDEQLHGALKVLGDLVEDCFNENQFFEIARDLVRIIYDVAINESRKPILRALAISVFRGSFDIIEMVMENYKTEVKAFANETIKGWIPFFVQILKTKLPSLPLQLNKGSEATDMEAHRGVIALKLQVVKVLMRIRITLPSIIVPDSFSLFSVIWEELSSTQAAYHQMYIEDEQQSRLEDADGLPYTLDFLVVEDLDFMQACLKAAPVRKELEQQLNTQTEDKKNWITEVVKLTVAYSQISMEEEALWDIDVNIFLSEETSLTTNYTSRTACGDLIVKLGEWKSEVTVNGLLAYTKSLYATDQSWKAKEAVLYVLNQLLGSFQEIDQTIDAQAAQEFVDFIRYAMQQADPFLRARGYLVAGSLSKTSPVVLQGVGPSLLEVTLKAVDEDNSEVVKVSCIRALQDYLTSIPSPLAVSVQSSVISTMSSYMSMQDLSEQSESDDLVVILLETLRDAILIDASVTLGGPALDSLFTIASQCANSFQVTMLVNETFESVCRSIASSGGDAYARLCEKVLPSLAGTFDVGNLTEVDALTNLAADLLSVLAENGSEPLPQGFVAAVMPKLNRILMSSTDEQLLRAATTAIKNILVHDYKQLFEWRDVTGKGGLEMVLIVIDRLLSPDIDDNAAAEVGGLAAELVEKAGSERLGPYLMQLLRAVAVRLASATTIQLIQSLTLVFARLSLHSAHEVVEFLSQVQIGQESGLQIVMGKWLEHSINFAGYDSIRQNVIALSKIYNLQDARLAEIMVKGDLIVPESDRIVTRSRAKQNPNQYTTVPVDLKIIKLLVEELLSASGTFKALDSSAMTAAGLTEENSDDDEWEDEPDMLDLSRSSIKQGKYPDIFMLKTLSTSKPYEPLKWMRIAFSLITDPDLMSYAEDTGAAARQPDDETQAYLVQFFRDAASKPRFDNIFNSLSPDQQEKLRMMST